MRKGGDADAAEAMELAACALVPGRRESADDLEAGGVTESVQNRDELHLASLGMKRDAHLLSLA